MALALETSIAYEQVAIEVTAAVAQREPDPYQAQTYRFGLLEDFDHLYRYAAMLDRLEGKDVNNILQGYTDIIPGRPTAEHHRNPSDDLRDNYNRNTADLITKIHAAMITKAQALDAGSEILDGLQHIRDDEEDHMHRVIAAIWTR